MGEACPSLIWINHDSPVPARYSEEAGTIKMISLDVDQMRIRRIRYNEFRKSRKLLQKPSRKQPDDL